MKSHVAVKLIYLDHLKVFLTILVMLTHAAISYGAAGSWFYQEVSSWIVPDSIILTMLTGWNQSFFMGLFFFISGCFVVPSLGKKTSLQFLADKLFRLGLPTAIFVLVLYPLIVWVVYYPKTLDGLLQIVEYQRSHISLAHTGPTWFTLVLCMLCALAIPMKSWLQRINLSPSRLRPLFFLAIAGAIAAITFGTMLIFPMGYTWMNIQLAYLPQYVFYFLAGASLGVSGINHIAENQKPWPWALLALGAFASLVLAYMQAPQSADFNGGWNRWAVLYAMAQACLSVSMSIVCLTFFFRVANQGLWLRGVLARAAYGTFFIHAIIFAALGVGLQSWQAAPLVKFLMLALTGIPLSFGAGAILAYVPGFRRIF